MTIHLSTLLPTHL